MGEQHMSDVVKEWNSSEHDQGIGEREVKALEPTHNRERRAQGHQEKVERRWVLRRIQERERTEKHRGLVAPANGVAVNVNRAQHDESRSQREPSADQDTLTTVAI